jgi:hypothetical protein
MPKSVCTAFNVYKQLCVYLCINMHVYNHMYMHLESAFWKKNFANCILQRGIAPSYRTKILWFTAFLRNCRVLFRRNTQNKGETMSAHTYSFTIYVCIYFLNIYIYIKNACSKYVRTYDCKTNNTYTHTWLRNVSIAQTFMAVLVADLNRNSPTKDKTSLVWFQTIDLKLHQTNFKIKTSTFWTLSLSRLQLSHARAVDWPTASAALVKPNIKHPTFMEEIKIEIGRGSSRLEIDEIHVKKLECSFLGSVVSRICDWPRKVQSWPLGVS